MMDISTPKYNMDDLVREENSRRTKLFFFRSLTSINILYYKRRLILKVT